MLNTVENFLIKHELNKAENTFLIGFSGGCDSLCLIDLLNELSKKYGFKIIALHLNHNWRGEESLQEEINCKRYCENKNIDYISETLELTERKTENIARKARYDFFLKYAEKYKNSSIFTAHTFSDNAETVIYRIIKGTGVKGLQGIRDKKIKQGYPVYRPLLSISRDEIEAYCKSKGLIPNIDSSNFDVNYKRNFIRHKIMPLFNEINFHAEKSINSLSELAVCQNNIVNEYLTIIKKDIYDGEKILTEKVKRLSDDVIRELIYEIYLNEKLDYDRKKINNILEFIKSNINSKAGSRYSLTNDLWIFVNYKYIYLITKLQADKNETEVEIKGEGEWKFSENINFSVKKFSGEDDFKFPQENELYAYVNLENAGSEFTLRTRREGDFIIPFGMKGKMKLKKFLNSKEVLKHERDEIILLCQGSEVLWVIGVGLSNKLKVVNKPSHVLKLTYTQNRN